MKDWFFGFHLELSAATPKLQHQRAIARRAPQRPEPARAAPLRRARPIDPTVSAHNITALRVPLFGGYVLLQ
eukprot:8970879-Pyramimonas_sp.AAC.1